jgi:Rod binding domain-containing protein
MSQSIGAIEAVGVPLAPQKAAASLSTTALHKVAKEFETLLVHQLLEAAKVGGESASGGYMGMAVDAMASGVSDAGGLGLTREIEAALGRAK